MTDIKERLRIVSQSPRSFDTALLKDALGEIERLEAAPIPIPIDWLKPGTIVPVNGETVGLLLRALRAASASQKEPT
jgi:hypothetical protein